MSDPVVVNLGGQVSEASSSQHTSGDGDAHPSEDEAVEQPAHWSGCQSGWRGASPATPWPTARSIIVAALLAR